MKKKNAVGRRTKTREGVRDEIKVGGMCVCVLPLLPLFTELWNSTVTIHDVEWSLELRYHVEAE